MEGIRFVDDVEVNAAIISAMEESIEILQEIAANLPDKIFVAQLGVRQKSPFLTLSLRESLLLRVEEVGRSAYKSLTKKDLCSATILARASLENAALMWAVYELVRDRKGVDEEAFNVKLRRLALGWRGNKIFPDAINILNMIDAMDKFLEGTRRRYDELSEIVHPNWSGVIGMYCSMDKKEFSASFARDTKGYHASATAASMALAVSLSLSKYAYNSISDMMKDWTDDLDKL